MNLNELLNKGKGLFVFSDPAGANSILAIIDFLKKNNKIHGIDFLIFTNKIGVFDKEYNEIVETIEFNDEFVNRIYNDFNPDYLFSATSNNDFELLWRRNLIGKIKIYSFIDHWTNYIERFSFAGDIIFGDYILVIDKVAKEEAVSAGIPKNIIRILENPYYHKVRKFKPTQSKNLFFKKHGLSINKLTILFISDNLSVTYPKNGNTWLGYDEYTVLSDLLACFENINARLNSNFQLVIKIHPKAKKDKFDFILKKVNFENLDIISIRDCDPLLINYYSDYVIGMHSNMILESFILRKKILRVQTGQLFEDLLKFYPLKNKVIKFNHELNTQLHRFLQ